MKTKQILLFFSVLTISLTAFSSCDKEDKGDVTKPVIKLNSPANDAILYTGSSVHLDLELSDDVMLSSYKVEIHIADGHSHTKAEGNTNFTFNKSWDISGKITDKIHHHEIIIPENATHGEYHFIVYCTDAAGNESHVVSEIKIENE